MNRTQLGVVVSAIVFAFVLLMNCFTVVPVGEQASVSSFGEVKQGKVIEGFNMVLPWWDIDEYNLQDRTYSYSDVGIASQDKFKTQMDIIYTGAFLPNTADIIRNSTGTSGVYLKTHVERRVLSCATKGGATVVNSQAFFEEKVLIDMGEYIKNCTNEYLQTVGGFMLSVVQISDIRLDPKVQEFMVETKKREEEENQARSELQIAETLAQKIVKTSEANLKAAENDKESRKLAADALLYEKQQEAQGNKDLSKSVTSNLVEYYKTQRWDGKLPTHALGNNTTMMLK